MKHNLKPMSHQQNGRVAVVLDVNFGPPITFPSPLCSCVAVRPLECWGAGRRPIRPHIFSYGDQTSQEPGAKISRKCVPRSATPCRLVKWMSPGSNYSPLFLFLLLLPSFAGFDELGKECPYRLIQTPRVDGASFPSLTDLPRGS